MNGLGSRCVFEAGRAENVMAQQVKRELELVGKDTEGTKGTRFIAVVDPAREGCHGDVLKVRSRSKRAIILNAALEI